MKNNLTPEQIDAILPQTQCGLCGYNGCMPYATALSRNEADINLCPPGGVTGLKTIAALFNKDPSPYIADMEQKAKPPLLAIIREDECIGCTKCIQACPVDAILGSAKHMHTIIASECTGCELCIEPCPVDCIDIMPATARTAAQINTARQRYQTRQQRLMTAQKPLITTHVTQKTMEEKKAFIQEAILRAKSKGKI